ncbi:URC4/urg3 family protein [Mycolicibacterium goodii]|uniref:URC4/urg3 family protein n=1 Tax=Mycolicibacterium goodii TaxID=134601 RepID=UPI000C25F626|nr:URC4/urg3 family protein [Mycolicibacterium goodii]PJK20380.1 uracil phosphoribosyltransferase [Mycolicibacterium goodii]
MNPTDVPSAVAALRTTRTVRERARFLLDRARGGESSWFIVDDGSLERAATEVAVVTRHNYPDLDIPYHSRWRHFEAGGIDRKQQIDTRLSDAGPRSHALIDLTVVSVLLDAGAGPDWRYTEADTGKSFTRSEGLGVASFHAFCSGLFSSDPGDPLRVDADGLARLDPEALGRAFQAGSDNPLVGLDGRVQLLHRLAAALACQSDNARPSTLLAPLLDPDGHVAAHDILDRLLASYSRIWLTPNAIDDHPLGDCWPHRAVPGPGPSRGWVPFHKLSQWLTYSLLEPFEWAGVRIGGLDELTGLPEYRNGGLFLDTGVLRLRDPDLVDHTWSVGDEFIVEWRALTVALLDEVAPLARDLLGAPDLPLACVLEGGTWAAGRALAQRLRGGRPPLSIDSDGTVF